MNRQQRSRDPLERRMDEWFKTGRQFVDGVAGNRPGTRRKALSGISNRAGLENAGRWMGEKLEWLFEEDENDWSDFSEIQEKPEFNSVEAKRPLEAVSLRTPKAITASVQSNVDGDSFGEWPDDSSFRLDRWKRTKDVQDKNMKSIAE